MDAAGMQSVWARMPLADAVLSVMGYIGDGKRLQAIFDAHRGRCYDDVIQFPDLVKLIGDALLEHGGSGNQSFSRARETGELEASKVAAYGKLGRLPIPLSQAFLTELTPKDENTSKNGGGWERQTIPSAAMCGKLRCNVPARRTFLS